MEYDKQQEVRLLRELFVLTAKRSLFPNMIDNSRQWIVFEELYALTKNEDYLVRPKKG